jgi:hypothetical protein
MFAPNKATAALHGRATHAALQYASPASSRPGLFGD